MRNILFLLALATSACATSAPGRPSTNVYFVRKDIEAAITANPGKAGVRAVYSMGAVSNDRAVVYTESDGERSEETWVRGPDGWTMADGKVVDATP